MMKTNPAVMLAFYWKLTVSLLIPPAPPRTAVFFSPSSTSRQREWWDSLLEVRILLQRLMNAANKLPGVVRCGPILYLSVWDAAATLIFSVVAASAFGFKTSILIPHHEG